MDVTLRALELYDAEAMWNLINEVKDEEKYLFYTLRFPKEGTAKYIEAHNASGNPVIGAFDAQGLLVGWIDMNRGGFEEIAHTASLGMGVAKSHRGMGLGSLLLKACVDSARRQGIEKIELEVFASNAAARALYAKMGFKEEGCLKAKRKFRGAYDDLVCMGLFL